MANFTLNGRLMIPYNGSAYFLYKIINIRKYINDGGGVPEKAYQEIFGFNETDIICAANLGVSPSNSPLGLGWIDGGIAGFSNPGKVYRIPSTVSLGTGNADIVWFCYRLLNNSDRDTVPPYFNMFNEKGDLSYTSRYPSLAYSRLLTVPDNALFNKYEDPNRVPDWSSTYNPSTEIIILSSPLMYTPKIIIMNAICPFIDKNGKVTFGIATSFSGNNQRGRIKKEILHNKITFVKKPTQEEQKVTPFYDGAATPVYGKFI